MAEVWNPPTFDSITTGPVVPASYLNQLGNSLRFLELIDWDEVTSDVTVSATSAATAVTVCSVTATTEAVLHVVRFHAARIHNPAGTATVTHLNFWTDSTDHNIWGSFRTAATGDTSGIPVSLEHFFTPTAAAHTFSAKAWRVTSNTTINGAAGTYMPIQMSLFRVPT